MERFEPEPRFLNRNFLLYMGGWAVTTFAYFGIQGVLFNLYLLRLGFGPDFVGALTGSGQLAWAICALPAGAFARRFGLRAALIVGALAQAAAQFALLNVEALPREAWPAWLFGWWIAVWVGASPLAVSGAPLLMQVSAPRLRRRAFTAQAVLLGVVVFVGSLLAGQLPGWLAPFAGGLETPGPYRVALMLVPLSYALAAPIWSRLKLAPFGAAGASAREGRPPARLFVALGVIVFLLTAAEGALRAFFNVYLDSSLRAPVSQIGLIGAVAQAISIAAALAIPAVLRRAGNANTLALVGVGVAVCMLVIAASATTAAAGAAFVVATSLIGIGGQARQLFAQELVEGRHRTTASSVTNIGVGLGWSTSSAAGGFIATAFGFAGLFGIGAVVSMAGAAVIVGFARLRGRPPAAT